MSLGIHMSYRCACQFSQFLSITILAPNQTTNQKQTAKIDSNKTIADVFLGFFLKQTY